MTMADYVIIGAGLAGTTLAWALVRRGRTVRLIDREPPTTATRVAAGLLTPVTGKKPAVSWRWHQLRPTAELFYRRVEAITGRRFFHPRPIVRVMTSDQEREAFRRREFADLVSVVDPPLNAEAVPQPFGAVLMPTAAQLDTVGYLDASREHFTGLGMYERGVWDGRVSGVTVLCQGYVSGGVFPLSFRPAKGEILTVRIPEWTETQAVNRGGNWLAPTTTEGEHRFGATYSWDHLDDEPTEAGRAELTAKLGELIRVPFEVVGHTAGVRPIVTGRKPVLGIHPTDPKLAVFNGLSSKGSLTAPFFADMLATHLCDGTAIEPEVDVRTRTHP